MKQALLNVRIEKFPCPQQNFGTSTRVLTLLLLLLLLYGSILYSSLDRYKRKYAFVAWNSSTNKLERIQKVFCLTL
jgi:hypothetical protein